MYSEEKKERYRESLEFEPARKKFQTVANFAFPFESSLGKDLSEFTKEDIINMVVSLGVITPETIRLYLNVIEHYQAFFSQEDGRSVPVVTRDDIDVSSVMRKTYFKSFSDAVNPISELKPPDQAFPEAAALALAWIGIRCPDACDLKREEVDVLNGTIQHGDIIKSFGDAEPKVLSILRSYANAAVGYRRQNPTSSEFTVSFVDSEFFLRPTKSQNSKKEKKTYTANNITSFIAVSRTMIEGQGINYPVTYENVLHSGELYRALQLERSGIDVLSKRNEKLLCSCFVSKIRPYDATYLYRAYKRAFNL